MAISDSTIPLACECRHARRLCRVGACPVLEARVTYPFLRCGEGVPAPALARFNQCYAHVAEAFLAWALATPAAEATAAFCALGPEAPYRYDRVLLLCTMTARWEGDTLTVTRALTSTTRRTAGREAPSHARRETDVWRLPALTLRSPRGGFPAVKLCKSPKGILTEEGFVVELEKI